ncbi:FG-GAP-like repeat-containing protein [Chitinophagales bacterium]|nr:FG-GAP-like repeat-containing protein [Chitinophagales bacterium]
MKKTILLPLFLFCFGQLFAQNIEVLFDHLSEIEVCVGADELNITVINTTEADLEDPFYTLSLPPGIIYSPFSFQELSTNEMIAIDLSSSESLTFESNNLAVGDSLQFSLSYTIDNAAVNYQESGGIFRHELRIDHTSDSKTFQGNSFNILAPALSIINITPTGQSIISGTSTTRAITVINGGIGKIDNFFLTDVFNDPALELTGTSTGTIIDGNIHLFGVDFTSIGNGDEFLDQNESIVITQTLTGSACTDKTVSSSLKTHWGCSAPYIESAISYANISIDFQNPQLQLASNESFNSCFNSDVSFQQELTITNTGQGVAAEVEVDLFKSIGFGYNESIYSRFDENSLRYKVGTTGQEIAPSSLQSFATQSSNEYSCLGNSPKGRLLFTIPIIEPGQTVYVTWDAISCCVPTCNNDAIKGWESEVNYTDICNVQQYDQDLVGQEENEQDIQFFTETPIDMINGVDTEFKFLVSGFENTLPEGDGAYYLAEFTLDADLSFQGLTFKSNNQTWEDNEIIYNQATNSVQAKFYTPIPFSLIQSELLMDVVGLCGNAGWKNASLDFSYVPDTNCGSTCTVALDCNVTVSSYLHCPDGNCNSLQVVDFSIQRTTLGSPDNDLNGIADNNSNFDYTKIRRDRAMVGDNITASVQSVIGNSSEEWEYARYRSSVDYGSFLSYENAIVTIYDASSNSTYATTGISPSTSTTGYQQVFDYDLSIGYLSTFNAALIGYEFAAGDSINIDFNYKVSSSVVNAIKETTFINEFYLSQVSNPSSAQKDNCNFRNGRFTLIGYSFRNDWNNNITVTNCSKIVRQYFGMSIGNVPSNYAGGNLFPYEYRSWGKLKNVEVEIPASYSLVSAKIQQVRTVNTNSVATQTINSIPAESIQGNTISFDIEQYYDSNQLLHSDDGFYGFIDIELAPDCNTTQNTWENINWDFNYQKTTAIDGLESGFIGASYPDRIRFRPAAVAISSTNPTQNTSTRTVSWDVKLKNSSSSTAANSWINILSPNNIEIEAIINLANGQEFPYQNGFFLLGNQSGNSTLNLQIMGNILNCDQVEITAQTGYGCNGYPNSINEVICPTKQIDLMTAPYPAAFQTRISSQLQEDPCSPLMELTIDITSVKIGNMFDMEISMTTPGIDKINILPNSSEFQYNISQDYAAIDNPALANNSYVFQINEYNSSISGNGIPGVMDITSNQYRLKTMVQLGSDFKPGDFLQVAINGENACSVNLPTVNLAIDPSAKFEKDNTSGIQLDIDNTWSASWGDYDNDGYDDLFIPVNELNEPSILYHNEGDGTFSKVTTGAIATDLGASISATWGDYDNDGFIDLFVANNESSSNRLYHNEGNGTFTSITNSPLIALPKYSHCAAWADYNKDGNLDIVVSDFHPTNFNYLFYGDGNGGFEVDLSSVISLTARSSVGLAWGDYDNDGDQDLFIANTGNQNNQLFKNNNGEFEEITTGDLVNDGGHSVGGVWGDYDNDEDIDLFVSNTRAEEANFFYENNGDGSFTKINSGALVENRSHSNGSSWADYDNDGDLDLIVANDQNSKNFLFSNNGDKTFTKLDNAITEEFNNSYGTAWSDYDNDGDYDLLVSNIGDNVNDLFVNAKGACTNHISVKLNGCNSNSFGIGASIKVKATIAGESVWQTKFVSSQTSSMGGQSSSKLLFGLSDAASIDSLIVEWPSGVVTTMIEPNINQLLTINESCGSRVCGFVYHDANENGTQDIDESGLANQEILISPNNFKAFTDPEGFFELYLEDGSYSIAHVNTSDWIATQPQTALSLAVNNATQSEYCGYELGATPLCEAPELELQLGTTIYRRGFTNLLTVVVENSGAGNATDSIDLAITFSNNVFLIGDTWNTLQENESDRIYNYRIAGIPAFSSFVLELQDSVSLYSELDELVSLNVDLIYPGEECNSSNNSKSATDVVVGSVDPNDKLVLLDGIGVSAKASHGQALIYMIRFQNVGNYEAQRVQLVDQLSEDLDWSTFEMLSSSHPFSTSIVNGEVTWINNKIALPDSTTNLIGSNGYVSFQIFPKADLHPFEVIENDALIQFDYNDYLRTNNTEIIISPLYNNIATEVIAYPNPTADHFEIVLIDENQLAEQIKSVSIYSLDGRLQMYEEVNGIKARLSLKNLNPNIYFAKVENENGEFFETKVIVY